MPVTLRGGSGWVRRGLPRDRPSLRDSSARGRTREGHVGGRPEGSVGRFARSGSRGTISEACPDARSLSLRIERPVCRFPRDPRASGRRVRGASAVRRRLTLSVRLTRGRLSVPAAMRELAGDKLGGVVVFAGRVRPDRRGRGRVVALEYEAHRALALAALSRLDRRARRRFGAERVVLWHRLGRVPVGEASVIVGVATGHRAPAFAASRFLIEQLKATVPIWKLERAPPARPRRSRPGGRAGRSTG